MRTLFVILYVLISNLAIGQKFDKKYSVYVDSVHYKLKIKSEGRARLGKENIIHFHVNDYWGNKLSNVKITILDSNDSVTLSTDYKGIAIYKPKSTNIKLHASYLPYPDILIDEFKVINGKSLYKLNFAKSPYRASLHCKQVIDSVTMKKIVTDLRKGRNSDYIKKHYGCFYMVEI